MPSRPDFFLVNPVQRSFAINARFNAPRNYSFAPTKKQLHEGIDIRSIDASGQPVAVLAAQRGVVDAVGFAPQGYGNYVRIKHKWGRETYKTWYGHLSKRLVNKGDFVQAGQKIGIAGTTGFSSGIHLHLTLQHIGKGLQGYTVDDVVDPEPFITLGPPPEYDEASFINDVSIPDGTLMRPGQEFTKTWRIRNTGTTIWDDGYRLVFVSGEQMGAPNEVPLPRTPVASGTIIDVSVTLTAPAKTGTLRSTWKLRDTDGTIFETNLFAEIQIKQIDTFNEARYVADVTVEDGTTMQPGETFVKTWRVRNSGTTTWDERYSLRFVGDDRMNGPDQVALTQKVKPGDTTEISVTLTAPRTSGRQRSTWKLHDPNGTPFEFEQYAEIQIPAKPKPPAGDLDQLRWIADVTVPDHTVMAPDESFLKTWRVRNSGTTTWGDGYELVHFSHEKMSGPDSVPLPAAKPGDLVEVSVPLIAPDKPGEQRSTWKPRDPDGNIFEFDLFALIDIVDTQPVDEMSWVKDMTVEDGTSMQPGVAFLKTWRVRNSGTTTWKPGYELAFVEDERMGGPVSVPIAETPPGDRTDISVRLIAPQRPGLYKSTWKGRNDKGQVFEHDMFALIQVVDPNGKYDMLEYLRGDGRVYDLQFNWDGGGIQRVQTQVEGNRFYHVKFREWEELWVDEHFIYRGIDTSPGGGEIYRLTQNGQNGSPWIPRHMAIGEPFQRMPTVTFYNKSNGQPIPNKQFVHVTWIELEAVHSMFMLPSGIELRDVAVLAAYEDNGGKPKQTPFEHYFYAKKYGLVAWRGHVGAILGQSNLVRTYAHGEVPSNEREKLSWL